MEQLKHAIDIADRIRQALEIEVVGAREQRRLIRSLDSQGLLGRAQERASFNVRLAELEQDLARELAAAGETLRLPEVTLDLLRPHAPVETERLTERFAELRALAEALNELDGLNRILAERAASFVRRYVSALTGSPDTYDRRGGHTTNAPVVTASRMA